MFVDIMLCFVMEVTSVVLVDITVWVLDMTVVDVSAVCDFVCVCVMDMTSPIKSEGVCHADAAPGEAVSPYSIWFLSLSLSRVPGGSSSPSLTGENERYNRLSDYRGIGVVGVEAQITIVCLFCPPSSFSLCDQTAAAGRDIPPAGELEEEEGGVPTPPVFQNRMAI